MPHAFGRSQPFAICKDSFGAFDQPFTPKASRLTHMYCNPLPGKADTERTNATCLGGFYESGKEYLRVITKVERIRRQLRDAIRDEEQAEARLRALNDDDD